MQRAKTNDVPNKKRRLFLLDLPKRPEEHGDVLVCGQGDMGQLGLGDDDNMQERKRPTPITSLECDVVDVVAGGMHSLVLTNDGILYSFGCNDEGALGRDCSRDGSECLPDVVNLPGKVIKISAGDSHSACLLEDGRVFSWGSFRDSHGNMGLTLEGNKFTPIDVLANETCCSIASGSDHLVMLTTKGKVFTVGCGEQGQLGRVSLRSASGEGRRGKTELLKPGLVHIRGQLLMSEIWTTNHCTFMRSVNNTMWAFGLNNYKQLLISKNVDTVITPTKINVSDVKDIAGGQHHTLVLKNDGTCHVIGRYDYGRLGLGKISGDVTELRQITTLANKKIIKIAAGESQSFAITPDGKIYAWGMGSNYQLGLPNDEDALVPTFIESKNTMNKRMLHVSSGGQHSIFIVARELNIIEAIDNKNIKDVQAIPKKKSAAANKKTKAVKETITTAAAAADVEINTSDNIEILTNGDKMVFQHEIEKVPVAVAKESATKENGTVKRSRKRAMKK